MRAVLIAFYMAVAVAAGHAETMRATVQGCATLEDLRVLATLTAETRQAAFRRKVAEDICTVLIAGEEVGIVERSGIMLRVETPEDGRRYWAPAEAVGE